MLYVCCFSLLEDSSMFAPHRVVDWWYRWGAREMLETIR